MTICVLRKMGRMPTEFKLPELGENIESGDLVRLMIKPGGSITEGEPVMELETDKAVVEVPSSVTGTVGEIRVKEGDKIKVGQVIFTVENGSGAEQTATKKNPKVVVLPAVQAAAAAAAPVSEKPKPVAAAPPQTRAAAAAPSTSASEF